MLAILSICVYFIKGDFSVQYKDMKASVEKIELSKNELKMINPRLEGHDPKSGSYLILADEARQKSDTPYIIHLSTINAELKHPQNGIIKLVANQGKFDSKSEVLDLEGDIRIHGDDGLKARLISANIKVKAQVITSNQPVFIERNGNSITAEGLTILGVEKQMDFKGPVKVRLIKTPEADKATE